MILLSRSLFLAAKLSCLSQGEKIQRMRRLDAKSDERSATLMVKLARSGGRARASDRCKLQALVEYE